MKIAFYLLLPLFLFSCSSESKVSENDFEKELASFRKSRNKKMAGNNSPIPKEKRKNFIALNFYPPNKDFQFKAKFDLIFSQEIIELQTNTDRIPQFIPFGKITFEYFNKNYVLTAYKSVDNPSDELFIPFTDLSNGKNSYITGRYLDLEIPQKDSITLDFNRCYNPYCAYNPKYSCPIPPSQNHIDIDIKAGEKKAHD